MVGPNVVSNGRDREHHGLVVTGGAERMWRRRFFERAKSPPTAEKHRHLAAAFRAWADGAVGTGSRRVVFDGFAGAGRFAAAPASGAAPSATLGSPLLLLGWLQERTDLWPVRLVLAEKDAANFSRLCEAVGWFLGRPAAASHAFGGLTVEIHLASFERCAAPLLAATPPGSCDVFSFVDPYGCDGVGFSSLCGLAARGTLLFHLATRAIHTKLVSASGASPKQARRMDALLGGAVPWTVLRERASSMDAPRARQLAAEVLVRSLGREQRDLRSDVIPLRGGRSHLVHTTLRR